MTVKIQHFLNRIKGSFWFIPSMMAILGIVLGYGLQKFDVYIYSDLDWTLTDSSGARAILTTVASSAITVAGLVFSITMVVLSTASSQYGPRLMRNFTRHRNTKIVLGGYIGIFIYCIMVIATIQEGDAGWVPQLSVTFGGALGLLSFALLIAFIQHVVSFLQASEIIHNVADQIREKASNIFPLNTFDSNDKFTLRVGSLPNIESESITILSKNEGYLQALNFSNLLNKTIEHNSVIRTLHKPGEYVLAGLPLAILWLDPSQEEWEDFEDDVNSAFYLGKRRTEDQDLEYAFDQLVEVAVRALSSGINDPFTAMNSIHKISGALNLIVNEGLPSGMIHDEHGKLRIASKTYTYAGLLDAAFNQIRQNCRTSEVVAIELMKALSNIIKVSDNSEFQLAVKKHADLLLEDGKESFLNQYDIDDLQAAYDAEFQSIK